MKKLIALYVLGILASVPAAIHSMFFATGAANIGVVVFAVVWILGFWACALPMYKLYRVRKLYKSVKTRKDLQKFVANSETRDLGVQTISKELGLPNFLAEKIYNVAESKLTLNNTDNHTASDSKKAA